MTLYRVPLLETENDWLEPTRFAERVTVDDGVSAFQAITATEMVLSTPLLPEFGGTGVNNGPHTITLNQSLIFQGNYDAIITTTGYTDITLPVSGTLAINEQLVSTAFAQTLADGVALSVVVPAEGKMYEVFVSSNQNGVNEWARAFVSCTPDSTITLHNLVKSSGISVDNPGTYIRLTNISGAPIDFIVSVQKVF